VSGFVDQNISNPIDDVESKGGEFTFITKSGTPNYMDSHHISVYGGQNLAADILSKYVKTDISKMYFDQ
jgi:hypothetical protein